MNQYERMARKVVYLVAGGFIVVGILDLAVYWMKCRHDQTPMSPLHCAYLGIPLVMGVAILVKTSALANYIEQYLNDE
jgi:hypothetical protein